MVYNKERYLKDKEGYCRRQRKYDSTHKRDRKDYFKKWLEDNRKHFNELMLKQYYKDKTKQLVRSEANRKITIPKGMLCQNCHLVPAIQKHHPDYSKPLDILFVCRKCHNKI